MLKSVRKAIASVSAIMLSISGINFGAMKDVGVMAKSEAVTETTTHVWGDVNCNGTVEMADAVFILQSVSNPDKYGVGKEEGITKDGAINADVYRNGDGITPADALSIQKFKLELITELPESYAEDETTTTTTTTTTTKTTTSKTTTSTSTTTTATTTTATTTTVIDGWAPPAKESLVHNGEQIDDDTYNILLATADLFNIEEYDIVWNNCPLEGAYTDPGYYYCMMNGMQYGYGVQILTPSHISEICPSMDEATVESFCKSMEDDEEFWFTFRPILPGDSEERVLESYEIARKNNGKAIKYEEDNIFVGHISNVLENYTYDDYEYGLRLLNQENMFRFMNWYLVPKDDSKCNVGPYDTSVKPGATIKYWFNLDDFQNEPIYRWVFERYVKTANQFNMHDFTFVKNDTKDVPMMYGFIVLEGKYNVYATTEYAVQAVPSSDLEYLTDFDAWATAETLPNDTVAFTKYILLDYQWYYWTLKENDYGTRHEEAYDKYWHVALYKRSGEYTLDDFFMVPLDENGNKDLRLYWPVS